MKVYHIAYDAAACSTDIHFWTGCNLKCVACYVAYNAYDFGLFDDPIAALSPDKLPGPPQQYLSLDRVMSYLNGLEIRSVVFVGTEPALDPELPELARRLHETFSSYNILLTNGFHLTDYADIDEVIFSIKAVSPDIHLEYTKKSNESILGHFKHLYETGIRLQAETVLIPGLVEKDEIVKIARFVASVNRNIPLRIDAFFPVPGCPWEPAESRQVEQVACEARKYLSKVNCLTLDMKRIGDKAIKIY